MHYTKAHGNKSFVDKLTKPIYILQNEAIIVDNAVEITVSK